jgi:hypothetical protein
LTAGGVSYRFLSVVGEGGFGRVYRARLDAGGGFQRDVAIKVLTDRDPPKALLQQFRDEARILALVRDRAFVGVEPPFRVDGHWAVIMEFVDGTSCSALIAGESSGIPPGVAVEIVGEIARALHHAFTMDGPDGEPLQLLHRDIKPDNVQVTPAGEVRLLDFGIARANFAEREFKTRHSLGGTPGYIAPERMQGVEVPAGDVYSLGVLLQEIVTGKRPRFTDEVELVNGLPTIQVDADIDADAAHLADPELRKVLALAAWMRADEPDARPTSRQVEELCRRLRQGLPLPYFREWAEEHVPHRTEVANDERVGRVFAAESTVVGIPLAGGMGSPSIDGERSASGGLAIGAILGGGMAMLVAAGLIAVLAVAWFVWAPPTAPTADPVVPAASTEAPAATEPVDEPAEDTAIAEPEVPEPPEVSVASPSEPSPPASTGGSSGPRVITVKVPTGPAAVGPAPIVPTGAAPTSSPSGPTGTVIVKTIPSGATVSEKGTLLSKQGLGYVLPVGSHVLDVRSPQGESTRIPVMVRKDDTVEICYSFDTNSACAG